MNQIYEFSKTHVNELYFKDFNKKYDSWINNVSEVVEKNVLNKLLLKMNFISKNKYKEFLKNYLLHYMVETDNYKNFVIIPMISKNRKKNSSYEVMGYISEIDKELEMMEDIELFPDEDTLSYDIAFIEKDDLETIIIVDDICGTGGTLNKFIKEHKSFMQGKKIIILFCVVTVVALEKIRDIVSENDDLNIRVDFFILEEKISDSKYLNDEEYKTLIKIESSLWKRKNNNILGYKKSELLVGFSHNMPNNTLSSFWYSDEQGKMKGWNTLFKRFTKKGRLNRKEENYDNAKKRKVK